MQARGAYAALEAPHGLRREVECTVQRLRMRAQISPLQPLLDAGLDVRQILQRGRSAYSFVQGRIALLEIVAQGFLKVS